MTPIAEGDLAYDYPYSGIVYVLVVRNALHVPSMDNNLIPPFIMRAGGISVNDIQNIHCEDLAVYDHCVLFHQSNTWMPLKLNGVFSYFHMIVSTER